MTIPAESEALHRRVQQWVKQPGETFDALACAIACYQAQHIEPIQRLWQAHGLQPREATRADQIPAVPCDAFRHRRIATHSAEEDIRTFMTSGTRLGDQVRGKHHFRTLASYAACTVNWAQRWLWPEGAAFDLIALVSDETTAPASSLSYMVARFAEALQGRSRWHWDGASLDVEAVVAECRLSISQQRRVLLAGTSFAFVHLCDALAASGRRLLLPAGSRVMQTGGFKGRSRQVDAAELRVVISQCLGVPESHIVSEYGMTELSSQLYQGGLCVGYVAPPWLRVTAVDPIDLQPVPVGEIGLCRLVDLLNVDSAVAILTADRIRMLEDGRVELLGRAAGAPARGCSLALESLLA